MLSSTLRVNSLPSSPASISRNMVIAMRLAPGEAITSSGVADFLPRYRPAA